MTSKVTTTGLQTFVFDTLHNEEARMTEYKRLSQKYGDRAFVIIEPKSGWFGRRPFDMKQTKFLVNKDTTFGQLVNGVRKQIVNMSPAEALFLTLYKYTDRGIVLELPTLTDLVLPVYLESRHPDGFMRIVVAKEETFGSFSVDSFPLGLFGC